MAVKTYDADEVQIIFAGYIIDGYGDGSFVNIATDEDAYSLSMGSNGEGCRSRSNNDAAAITITLMQSSDSNDVLSGLHEADKLTGAGALPLLIKDGSGRSLYSAETAWVQKTPDSEFARESGSREWMLRTDKLVPFIGGN